MTVILTFTLAAVALLYSRHGHGEEASVWMMQLQEEGPDTSSGYVDHNGVLNVELNRDVRIQLSGNALHDVARIAFTPANASRGDSQVFAGMSSPVAVTEPSEHNAIATVRFPESYAGMKLFLVIFVANKELPIYQGLALRPIELTASLPFWLVLLLLLLLLTLSSLFSGKYKAARCVEPTDGNGNETAELAAFQRA